MKAVIQALLVAATSGAAVSQAALVSHWKFDETSGTTAVDSAGTFNGTLSGGTAFVGGGISGNAVSLAEISNSLVNMGTSFPGFISGDFSIMSWVKTTTAASDTILLSKHTGGTGNGYLLGVNANGPNGAANKAWFYATSSVANTPISSTAVNDGAWHQIVAVYKAGVSANIYVDGAPVETSHPALGPIAANASPFLIGGFVNGVPIATYTGLVDEVQVYSDALSDSDVQFLFENPGQSVPEPASLVLLTGGGLLFLGARRRAPMPS